MEEVKWRKYYDLEPIRRLRNEGRELIGKLIYLTEKRDGENVSVWIDSNGEYRVSSHNLEQADSNIINRLKLTPEYVKIIQLLIDDLDMYEKEYIAYGELLKRSSPTRLEPRRKYTHWILFDVYDCGEKRFLGYNNIYQKAYHYKIPIVRIVDTFIPSSLDELNEKISLSLKWCRRHRREGVVGKDYKNQIFFKEKVDLPDLPRIRKPKVNEIVYPSMPDETKLRALQHAFDEVGEENWKDIKVAMPIVAKHFEVEAREHNYSRPRNIYKLYLEASIEDLKP